MKQDTQEATPIGDVLRKQIANLPSPRSDLDISTAASEQAALQREAERAWRNNWDKAHIPPRFARKIELRGAPFLETFRLLSSGANTGRILAFCGPRGPGKTRMAVELMRKLCESVECRYCVAMEIFMDVRKQQGGDRDEAAALKPYITPGLLVIDEIQERGETAFEDRLLTYLIDKRYGAMRETIVIGNLTETEMMRSVGSSVASRLLETGGVVLFDWPSFRGPPGG